MRETKKRPAKDAGIDRGLPREKHSSGARLLHARLVHESGVLREVMMDVLSKDPDDSYCFLNEGVLRERMSVFREHFLPGSEERRIIYAMKANPKNRILEILTAEGLNGFDCASLHEVYTALDLPQVAPDDIYFNHPIKSPSAVAASYQRGVRYYTIQSREGLKKVLDVADIQGYQRPPEVVVRVETPNPSAGINLSEKYGCSQEDAVELMTLAADAGARVGLSMHTGSQNRNIGSFKNGIALLGELAQKNDGVDSINIGGGLPVNYADTDHENLGTYLYEISKAVTKMARKAFKKNYADHRVIIEPGRALVADAVDLVIPILEIDRRRDERRLFMNDGIFTSFSDASIHDWKYHFRVVSKDGRKIDDERINFTLFGRTCDSGDQLGSIALPANIKEGDYLWVKSAGAYMDSQASPFNGFEPPTYISYNT